MSGEAGSISDFTASLDDYGATQPTCYEFKGAGAGKGVCVKNNAASVWNPAFDVTPNALVSGIITERGICRAPFDQSLHALFE